ncbi:MAG: diguanylate cyclase, partial [Woeseiaceae bacterium]
PLCRRCGLDAVGIAERLQLVELDSAESQAPGRVLHEQVVRPNVDAIIDRFYAAIGKLQEFSRLTEGRVDIVRERQKQYLLGLGVGIDRPQYFEDRLRVGAVHQRIGISQSLYQCTFQGLQSLLIKHIPDTIRDDAPAFEALLEFILKVTTLDVSLAVESYCSARVSDLKRSLDSERGETHRLRKLAITDALTGLYNHSHSRRCLANALQEARDEGRPLCVVMADLDHFKDVNDTHGHLIGDEVLRIAASRMVSGARADDEVCRYGGEEFLFVLRNSSLAGGTEVAERVRARISRDDIRASGKLLQISVSLGVAEARAGDTVDTLIDRADAMLYAAKAAGRNCLRAS